MKPSKAKVARTFTRAQAELALSTKRLPPETFIDMSDPTARKNPKANEANGGTSNHGNYHVRRKAWTMLGCPKLADDKKHAEFLASLHVKPEATEATDEPKSEE